MRFLIVLVIVVVVVAVVPLIDGIVEARSPPYNPLTPRGS
jgi:hypothetical protein